MKPIPQVGQTLYSLNIHNAARHAKQELTPVIVRKIGRKYFECSTEAYPTNTTQYALDTWQEKTSFSAQSMLYADPQEWQDKKDAEDIACMIRKTFDMWSPRHNLSLSQLRQIRDILKS